MLKVTTVENLKDLEAILRLQRANLKTNIDPQEMESQGFVTMQFSLPMLQGLHGLCPSVVIKNDEVVVAYALMVKLEGRKLYPSLESMFVNFEGMSWKGKPFYDYQFYIMGQICIDKDWRGKGLFGMLYHHHRELFSKDFDFVITEVSTSNTRSLRAHEKLGFQTVLLHKDELDEWAMVLWDWR